ncbi:unnamed protein product [Pleuronectes platessa]|uniref:Uncharacterized protein n=1 Tax=Pleuronectes platessa TaxID=8262 RepID=A0A9N7V332_PLEPL|nr:unnamed protein product [Pleuronectes platessa]
MQTPHMRSCVESCFIIPSPLPASPLSGRETEHERKKKKKRETELLLLTGTGVLVFVSKDGANQLSRTVSGERLSQSHRPGLYPGASQPNTALLRHRDNPGIACRDNKDTKTTKSQIGWQAQTASSTRTVRPGSDVFADQEQTARMAVPSL